MRTNIEIDDQLMAKAMRASRKGTKRAVVEEALQLLVRTHQQGRIRRWRGKVRFDSNEALPRASGGPR